MPLDAERDIALRRALDAPPKLDRRAGSQAAARGGGSWLGKYFAVMLGPGRLTVDEFFYYRAYDPAVFPERELPRLLGKRAAMRFHLLCNDRTNFAIVHDKALFYTLVKGAGFSVPESIAIYAPRKRPGYPTLQSKESLAGFLRDNARWPLFAKPIDGMYSIGALRLDGRDGDGLAIHNAGVEPLSAFVDYATRMSDVGYLFQAVEKPSAFSQENFADTLGCIRFFVLCSEAEPQIESAVIKIPSGRGNADNYWRDGNMLGAIDLASGEIVRAISGTGENLIEVETHPATGARLKGMRIPEWDEFKRVVLEASGLLPGVKTQSWDIALSEKGPMLLEVNFGGDVNLHQLAHRRGILTDSYLAHLKRCGVKVKLPAAKA